MRTLKPKLGLQNYGLEQNARSNICCQESSSNYSFPTQQYTAEQDLNYQSSCRLLRSNIGGSEVFWFHLTML